MANSDQSNQPNSCNQPAPEAGSSVDLIPHMTENNKQVAFKILSDFLSKITPVHQLFASQDSNKQLKQLKDKVMEQAKQHKEQMDQQWALDQLEKMLALEQQ
ncbi:hypothetical protein PGTUg99_003704 [Puccinia graminis f. sp. tritici]|uniref:Uncharacterized protein n=1 Tax=Puccinia graminis f. sp. tritici TaxID=56615 RepID=A0A5B0P6J5_PUCGR|nr:hypothetical protein PGTUg99_003704 [Puccinia graminis f. sp. tritici]